MKMQGTTLIHCAVRFGREPGAFFFFFSSFSSVRVKAHDSVKTERSGALGKIIVRELVGGLIWF